MNFNLSNSKAAVKSAFVYRQQKNNLPQTLIFFVTSRCNARCEFCLYKEQVENPVAKERELTVSEIEKIAGNYGNLHYLALSGGEPFIRKDIEPMCQAFIDRCGTTVIDIPSNFYYSESMVNTMEPLARKNPGVIFDLQMSIDDTGEAHNQSRKVKNLYRKAIQTFHALASIRDVSPNLKLKVNIVYLEQNKNRIGEILSELSKEVEFDRVQLTYPHDLLDDSQAPKTEQSVREYSAAADTLTSKSSAGIDPHTLGMLSVKRTYHRLLHDAVSRKKNLGSYCEAGRHILVIDEKGDVFPCEPLMCSVGNLRDNDYSIKKILADEAYARFRDQHLGPGKCNCTWSCAIHSSISVSPRYFPELAVNAVRALLDQFNGSDHKRSRRE